MENKDMNLRLIKGVMPLCFSVILIGPDLYPWRFLKCQNYLFAVQNSLVGVIPFMFRLDTELRSTN